MTYTQTLKTLPLVIATCLVSACGGAGTGTSGGTESGGRIVVEPPAPTANPDTISTTINRIGVANALPIPFSPATGSASYKGGLLADATINGERGQKIFANIDANANFASGTFSGTVRNFNLVNASNVPTEGIGGSLTFNGQSNGLSKNAIGTATGTLQGNFGGDTSETVRMSMGLTGKARGPNVLNNMSTIEGDVSGGSLSGEPVDINLNGEFYLRDDL